jgi:hypothetical protein
MNIVVVYVFPVFGGTYEENACRFIATYNQNPAGMDHRLIVVSNGGPPTIEMRSLFEACNHPVEWLEHDNRGWDMSAFQEAARVFPCEMMLFLGNSAYLRRPQWLSRMAEAFVKHGNGAIYGSTANCGDPRVNVFPHIRTTGFWMAPMIMNMYPLKVTRPEQRYPAEHGPNCLTEWAKSQGYPAFMVTWDAEAEWPHWDGMPGGFHRDQQQGILVGDRLTAPPYYPHP